MGGAEREEVDIGIGIGSCIRAQSTRTSVVNNSAIGCAARRAALIARGSATWLLSLSSLSNLSSQSSGDSDFGAKSVVDFFGQLLVNAVGGELGGDSRCTITWQNLRFG